MLELAAGGEREPSGQPPAPCESGHQPQRHQQLVAALPLRRKEKARIAARARRSQEASIISEMAEELSITQERKRRIDKATIVRLAIDYIRAFEALCRSGPMYRPRRPAPQRQVRALQLHLPLAAAAPHSPTPPYPPPRPTAAAAHSENRKPGRGLLLLGEVAAADKLALQEEELEEPAPRLSTGSIFAPKTRDMDRHFLVIGATRDGRPAFIFKPDDQIRADDDLTHLAPQAGDASISLEAESLDGIQLDSGLFQAASPAAAKGAHSPPPQKRPMIQVQQHQQHHQHQHQQQQHHLLSATRLL